MTSLLRPAGEDFASILTSLGYRVRRTPKVAAPATPAEVTLPVETEAQIDAVASEMPEAPAEAAPTPAAFTDADEGATAPAEAAPVAEAAPAAEAAAAPADAEAKPAEAESNPAEPEFDEVWFPGGRRPDNPRHQNRRPPRAANGNDAPAAEGGRPPRRFNNGPRPEGGGKTADNQNKPRFDKPPRKFGDDKKPFEGKPKFNGKRDRDRDDWKEHRPREKRDVPLDPDSPWAALAALRNPKPE